MACEVFVQVLSHTTKAHTVTLISTFCRPQPDVNDALCDGPVSSQLSLVPIFCLPPSEGQAELTCVVN